MNVLFLLCIIAFVSGFMVSNVQAAPVSIELSNSCLTMIKNNITDSCPSYSYLKKYDTTNPKYSGKFVLKDGIEQRGKPQIKNHVLFYKGNVTIVDPDPYTKERSKLIIIEVKMPAWFDKKDRITDNTLISYAGRHVDGCHTASIKWNEKLLQDTINYLNNGCTYTEFDNKIVTKKPYSKLSYEGQHYKHLKFLEEAKKLKGINCLKSDLC